VCHIIVNSGFGRRFGPVMQSKQRLGR
jgi:hypothetical protein